MIVIFIGFNRLDLNVTYFVIMWNAALPQLITPVSSFINQVSKMQFWLPFIAALATTASYVQAAGCECSIMSSLRRIFYHQKL
jgi:hypothetical protein